MPFMVVLPARPRKTIEDLHALPENVRGELIDGEVYVTPAPFEGHQTAVLGVASALRAHTRAGPGGIVLLAPFDVFLPSGDVVQPDVLWISKARSGIVHEGAHGAPDVVVEVVSTAHPERDRIVKRALYGRNGVREYWLVDLQDRAVEVLRLEEGRFVPAGYFRGEARIVSSVLPGLKLAVQEIFG